MPKHTAAEREKKRQGKSAAAIAAADAAEQGTKKPAAKPTKKPVEKRGVGRSDAQKNADRIVADLRSRLNTAIANRNMDKAANLRERIKAVQATVKGN